MQLDEQFQLLLALLQERLQTLEDKPEETSESTLRALWFTAAGIPKSAQSARHGDLPPLDENQRGKLQTFVEQRLRGEPLAHITKRQRFLEIELLAGPEALVPRIETEILGNAALEKIHKVDNPQKGPIKVIDICTGAGNLAVAYAVHAPHVKIFAADISGDAVLLARKNTEFVGVADRVEVREGDLLAPFDGDDFLGTIDVISCNPPYISSNKVDNMHEEIANYEPRLAFDGGPFGIKILQRLCQEAPRYLKAGGWLAFEVGLGQGPAWIQRLTKNEHYSEVHSVEDKQGNIRVILAKRAED